MSRRTFDITMYSSYFLMFWHFWWCYDILFKVMAYLLTLWRIFWTLWHNFWLHDMFRCHDIHLIFLMSWCVSSVKMTYFLTSRHTFHNFWRHDILFYVLTYFVYIMTYIFMAWCTFWHYDLLNKAIKDGKYLALPHASVWQRSPH